MLRITITDSPSEQKWTLQGRLTGPWIAPLQSNWKKKQGERLGRKCVVDLTELTFVDTGGEKVLRAMMKEGAQFIACGVCIRHLLKSLEHGCKKKRAPGSATGGFASGGSDVHAASGTDRDAE